MKLKHRTHPDGSAILDRAEVLTLTGQLIDEDYFTHWPFGHYLNVVVDLAPAKYGDIILPDGGRERISAGYVIAVGPLVGTGSPYPGGPSLNQPADLLGRRVVFGLSQGSVLRADLTERGGEVLMLTDMMLRNWDENPEPVAVRLERKTRGRRELELVA